ncbi:MAG: hypothetical protein HC812_18455 [Leptolyngbya sp. RL_3_1]|nr:hypothetical protein [Leptolyngbya sp. RL_3_1]
MELPVAGQPETTNVAELIDTFITARNISQQQYQDLSALVLADGTIDEQERRQINRLFDAIQMGMVKITD